MIVLRKLYLIAVHCIGRLFVKVTGGLKEKAPTEVEASLFYARRRPTLPAGNQLVPSALEGLTAVFGMGTGGAPPPLPPGNNFRCGNLTAS
jgi:hypothetical protein